MRLKETRKTVCNRDCPDVCSIVAHLEDGRVTRLSGDPEHPLTKGFLCYRTNHFLPLQYSPDRLTMPLARARKGGELLPIGWDEALALVAERLTTIKRESGASAIFHYRSGGSLGILKHLSDYFFAKLGPVTVKRGDICAGGGTAAQLADFGEVDSHDIDDLHNAKNVILWGKNVFTSSPHLIPVLKEARARGAEIVLVDPVHHKTASLADVYVQPRPAGDFALAMAVGRILFERGWTDPDAATYCDHLTAFRALTMRKSVEAWCVEADVAPASAEDLARRLGVGRPCAIVVGWGMGRRGNGAAMVRALDAIAAVSGNLGVPGGGVSFYFKRRAAFDTAILSDVEPPPRTICEPLFGPELLAMRDPPIRAVWITAGNPVAMMPESQTTARALAACELVVVVDAFLTDTARLADLVLPTTTLLEADDLLGSYGHHYLGVARPVVAPPPGVKSDLEILQALAPKVGLAGVMDGTAREWKERFVAKKLAAHGVTLEALENGAVKSPLAKKVLFEGRVFATASGRVNLLTDGPAASLVSADFPLVLMSLSTEDAQSSQWSRPQEGPAEVTVHPDAASGIADGGAARVESALGALVVRVRHDAQQRRDVLLIPKGGHLKDGRCANVLVRAATTDLGEGAALYDERVRLVPIDGAAATLAPTARGPTAST